MDIDGCLLEHKDPTPVQAMTWVVPVVLPGSIEKLITWYEAGYKVILTTGRKACYRDFTIWQLQVVGIMYDQLVMDVGTGPRVLVNDNRPGEPEPKALCFNLERNAGLGALPI